MEKNDSDKRAEKFGRIDKNTIMIKRDRLRTTSLTAVPALDKERSRGAVEDLQCSLVVV